MALQTETSSSTTSTTTATAAASTTSSSGSASFFNPNSSTPLVLAFLGIGLVAAGIILFLGWRRQQLARIWAERFDSRPTRKDVSRDSPKLWDLWTDNGNARAHPASDSGVTAEVAWGSVMPISATPVIPQESDQPRETAPDNPPPPSLLSRLNSFRTRVASEVVSFVHLYRQHPLQIQAARSGMPANAAELQTHDRLLKGRDPGNNESLLEELRGCEGVQVVMAIGMPKQKPMEGEHSTEDVGSDIHDYSIGICRITWDGSVIEEHGLSTGTDS